MGLSLSGANRRRALVNPAQGVFGSVMHGTSRAVKKPVEPQHAVMRGTAASGADGDRRRVKAFALRFGERRDKILAHRDVGVIDVHKIRAGYFSRLDK